MIKQLINQVMSSLAATPESAPGRREAAIRTATAVLMVDVARADNVFEDSEFDHLLKLIQAHFDLSPEDAVELFNRADEHAEELVSLHEFTQLLHNELDEEEKAHIIGHLWQIAYADGRLDKYEDSLVLKISDLLHVSRGRVMRLKHDAANGRA